MRDLRKATVKDIPAIMDLFAAIVQYMKAVNINQWDEEYPNLEIVTNDIANQHLYALMVKEQLAGVMTLNKIQEPQYQTINWLTKEANNLVIHRLAIHPKFHRQGLAKQLLAFSEQVATEKDCISIRLDAYSKNKGANQLYLTHDYQYVGDIFFPRRTPPFHCYEKVF